MRAFVTGAVALTGALALLTAAAAPSPAAAQTADWRPLDLENTLVIETTKGRVVVELSAWTAPNHIERIKTLTRAGFYDGLIFHRVLVDFMAQTGDPLGTGAGGSDLPNLADEFTFQRRLDSGFGEVTTARGRSTGFVGSLPVVTGSDDALFLSANGSVETWAAFCPGVVAMARQRENNTGNSQFFLMRGSERNLDRNYTPLGYVVQGLEVVYRLNPGEPPRQPDKMTTVRIASELPQDQQPRLRVMDVRSAAFKALVAKRKKEEGDAFDICSVQLPAQAG